jgi:hypothetical protein
MLTAQRRDRRTRRQADFHLECLDSRLVLSAAAGAAVADAAGARAALVAHRHEVQAARHEARLARIEARHEARVARVDARLAARADARAIVTSPVSPAPSSASMSPSTGTSTALASASPSMASTPMMVTTPTSSARSTTNVSTAPVTPVSTPVTPTQTSPGPLSANVAAALQSLYSEYKSVAQGNVFTPSLPSDNLLVINGDNVGVNLQIGSSSNFSTALSQLEADGMQVSASSTTYSLIDGMLPIDELPTAAQIAMSVTPLSPVMQR